MNSVASGGKWCIIGPCLWKDGLRVLAELVAYQAGLNPKHEIQNSKQSQMLKFQMSQTKEFREFEFWKFEFVSDFSTPKPVWFRLCRVRVYHSYQIFWGL
jgi:hypothetical protein